ncbi:hypothetical protein Cob_v004681 [Colletotrichum orbiculare MAFF 240422]|uniref:Uncharacterized protein n=1 Tax=Colletotrichum orbiculare (strain 104-T / ATCC 96160 / CBS 514.97 / LARS 414 / MAFF 240422) TaxID=1213857 RepID=A0A484FWI4_COLOR|nr:hypothetical protein Cob_v004681 [Colletotrichum orbiculare MAFF 240422]
MPRNTRRISETSVWKVDEDHSPIRQTSQETKTERAEDDGRGGGSSSFCDWPALCFSTVVVAESVEGARAVRRVGSDPPRLLSRAGDGSYDDNGEEVELYCGG